MGAFITCVMIGVAAKKQGVQAGPNRLQFFNHQCCSCWGGEVKSLNLESVNVGVFSVLGLLN